MPIPTVVEHHTWCTRNEAIHTQERCLAKMLVGGPCAHSSSSGTVVKYRAAGTSPTKVDNRQKVWRLGSTSIGDGAKTWWTEKSLELKADHGYDMTMDLNITLRVPTRELVWKYHCYYLDQHVKSWHKPGML